MDNLDDLKQRIEKAVGEIQDLIGLFEIEIADPQKTVPFAQVKEIENSIARLKKQRLSVPKELQQLKLSLISTYEKHQEFMALYEKLQADLRGMIFETSHSNVSPDKIFSVRRTANRKLPNYEKPLGSKGNSNLTDYLIPVITLMWRGCDHKESFRRVADKLDVRYNTVSSQCTRGIGLNTEEFIDKVDSKAIVEWLETKYPDQYQLIKSELRKRAS